jgi:hypothetical protein
VLARSFLSPVVENNKTQYRRGSEVTEGFRSLKKKKFSEVGENRERLMEGQ